jgi:RNA polymerase sigma-70 factor (ECF subfamily)
MELLMQVALPQRDPTMTIVYDDVTVEIHASKTKMSDLVEVRKASDVVLVSNARAGDFDAFGELARRYRNDVFRLCCYFTRDREDAWDLAQETFVKAYCALGSFRGDANFKTWLLRIAANLCKDFLKKRKIQTVEFDDALRDDETRSAIPEPDHAVEADEIGRAIEAALQSLPIKHRTAFILREYEGLSYEEMAHVMNCNIGTVMSRLHHARRKLQQQLIQMGVDPGGSKREGNADV